MCHEEKINSEKEKNLINTSNSPYLINHNDEIGQRLKGVFDDVSKLKFDPIQVETEMLTKSMWTVFTGLPYVSPKLSRERAARLQELLHFCSTAEIANAGKSSRLNVYI
jgi:hypothetical protein